MNFNFCLPIFLEKYLWWLISALLLGALIGYNSALLDFCSDRLGWHNRTELKKATLLKWPNELRFAKKELLLIFKLHYFIRTANIENIKTFEINVFYTKGCIQKANISNQKGIIKCSIQQCHYNKMQNINEFMQMSFPLNFTCCTNLGPSILKIRPKIKSHYLILNS